MHWSEPATSDDSHAAHEKTLWDAANQLWSNAALKPSEYSPTVLGLIFLRYADVRFAAVKEEIQPQAGSRRKIGPTDFHAAGVVYLPDEARFSHLLSLPEGANVGQAVNEAMRAIEKENPDLADVMPKSYHILESRTLASLLKTMASIPMDKGGDTFGLIYEYFLGKFAMSEGQKGGEWSGATWTLPQERPEGERGGAHQFYTPTSIVRLIVEILEPYHGRILDPACGSGGMFIQSARFVEAHQKNPTSEISVHGQERVTDTARLARLNLAVHGLSGDIKQGNTYYEDLQDSVGRFDFVLANPPFNVSKIDKERLAGDPRYPFGIPRTDNGNYCLGRGVYSISSEHQSFVDQMFANELPTLLGMTSGSTFPSWTGPVLQSHPVISPPKALVSEFDRMALPMSDAIQNLAFRNDNLRCIRDLLLPKLLSA